MKRVVLLLACAVACKTPVATREDAHAATAVSVASPVASSVAELGDAATEAGSPTPWQTVYEGDIQCDPGVGPSDVVVVSYESPDWFVNLVPLNGKSEHWLGHPYMIVEGCDVAEDQRAIYVVHAGVLVPSGKWGTIRRYDRGTGKMNVFYRPKVPLRGAVADDGAVYTIRGDVTFEAVRVDATTGAEAVVLPLPRDEEGFSVAVNRDSVFVAACPNIFTSVRPTDDQATACEIRMAPKSGRGTANVLRGQMGTATYMRADDTTLYFTDATNGIVGRVSLADRKTTVLARDQNHPSSLDVDAEHVFFTSGGKLMSVSKDAAGPVKRLDETTGDIASVRVQGDFLVVHTNGVGSRVLRAKRSELFAR